MSSELINIPLIHLPREEITPSTIQVPNKNLGKGYDKLRGIREDNQGVIAFLTGCFDLRLHEGHETHLQQARGYDPRGIVVVGLNSDVSVRKLKGPDRPIDSEDKRLDRILRNSWVDYAFIFPDQNAILALMLLNPDVYITFHENLFEKKEIEHIASKMPGTVFRINTYFAKDPNGNRISTSSALAMRGIK